MIFRSFDLSSARDIGRFDALCAAIRWAVYLYVLIGGGLIVGTRLHYTLDVLVAMLLTYSVFTWYHSWLRCAHARGEL